MKYIRFEYELLSMTCIPVKFLSIKCPNANLI